MTHGKINGRATVNDDDSCYNWTYDIEVILLKMSRYWVE